MASKPPRTKSPAAKTSKPKAGKPAANKPKAGQNLRTSGKEISSETIVELIQRLPDEAKLEVYREVISTSFSGPLPHPDHFEKYNQILPSAADRILTMAEIEQQIDREAQAKMLINDSKRINSATAVALSMIAAAIVATVLGSPIIAISLGLSGIIAALARHLLAGSRRK